MAEAITTAGTAAQEATKVAHAHLASVDTASVVIAGVKDNPAAQKLIAAAQSHGETLVAAVEALVAAVDFDKVAASAEAGHHSGNAHIDVAKLGNATEGLKKASDLSTVVGAVNEMSGDDTLIGELRDGFKKNGLSGGYDDVRGALKCIDVDQIGVVQHLEAVIGKLHADSSADAEALTRLHKDLEALDANLKKEFGALLGAVDGFVAKLAA